MNRDFNGNIGACYGTEATPNAPVGVSGSGEEKALYVYICRHCKHFLGTSFDAESTSFASVSFDGHFRHEISL